MFNGRFGFTRFSLNSKELEPIININEGYYSELDSICGFGKEVYFEESFQSFVLAKGAAFNGLNFSYSSFENLQSKASLHANIVVRENLISNAKFTGRLDKTLFINDSFQCSTLVKIAIGKSVPFEESVVCSLKTLCILGKVLTENAELSAIVNCVIDISVLEYKTAIINITIPPGGEIRIDSDNFLALFGNESILHLYEGDWINIDRNTKRIVLNSGSGGILVGEVVYTERFL